MRNRRTLATYTLHRNPQDLLDEITFKTAHYRELDGEMAWHFGKWAQLETLLHEQIHVWQQNFGEHPVKPGKVSHNKEFITKCESFGLRPMPIARCYVSVADGLSAQLVAELGIPRPQDVPSITGEAKKDLFRPKLEKGRSSLHKWVCPDCGLSVRMGIGGNPHLVHDV